MPSPLRYRLRQLRRHATYALAVVLVLVAVLVGTLNQLLPLVERHPEKVAAWLSERAGQPVAFDHLDTAWTRRGPLMQFDGLRIGEAGQKILEYAQEQDADLVIVGRQGAGAVGKILFGNVTERVVRKAGCPVLVIPPTPK